MSFATSSSLNMIELFSSLTGEKDSGPIRSAKKSDSEEHGRFQDFVDQEIEGESKKNLSRELQNLPFFPNLMTMLPENAIPTPKPLQKFGENKTDLDGSRGRSRIESSSHTRQADTLRNSSPIDRGLEQEAEPEVEKTESIQSKRSTQEEETRAQQTERSEKQAERSAEATDSRAESGSEHSNDEKNIETQEESADAEQVQQSGNINLSEMGFSDFSEESMQEEASDAEILKAAAETNSSETSAPTVETKSTSQPASASTTSMANTVAATSAATNTTAVPGANGSASESSAQPGTTPIAAASGSAPVNNSATTNGTSETTGTPRTSAPQIPEKILKTLQKAITNGDNDIQIRLDPPELGDLRLNIKMDGNRMEVILHVSSEVSKQALEEALPQLRQMLEDDNVKVQSFVVQSETPEDFENSSPHNNEDDNTQDGASQFGSYTELEEETSSLAWGDGTNSSVFSDQGVNMVA